MPDEEPPQLTEGSLSRTTPEMLSSPRIINGASESAQPSNASSKPTVQAPVDQSASPVQVPVSAPSSVTSRDLGQPAATPRNAVEADSQRDAIDIEASLTAPTAEPNNVARTEAPPASAQGKTIAKPVAAPPSAVPAPAPVALAVVSQPEVAAVVCIAGCSGQAGKVVDVQPAPKSEPVRANSLLVRTSLASSASPSPQHPDSIVCIAGCYTSPRSYPARPSALLHRPLVRGEAGRRQIAQPSLASAVARQLEPAAQATVPTATRPARLSRSVAARKRMLSRYSGSEWFTNRFRNRHVQ